MRMEETPVEPVGIDAIRTSRAVGYVRISSEDKQGSLEDQLNTILNYAAARDIEVVEFYRERDCSSVGERNDQ